MNSMKSSISSMKSSISSMNKKIDGITHILSPLSDPLIASTPVITTGSLLTNRRNGVFTWCDFGPGKERVAIGAAHTALRYATVAVAPSPADGSHLLFVMFPDSVLNLGVKKVFFVDAGRMSNPLPSELDVCVVQVASKPPDGTYVPRLVQGQSQGGTTLSATSGVVGKSIGSFVSSCGGFVEVSMDQTARLGHLHFLLEAGEPDDSGTLLYTKTNTGNVPNAIFTGLSSATTARQARGLGCVIPPESAFQTCLEVVDITSYGVTRVMLCSRNGMGEFTPVSLGWPPGGTVAPPVTLHSVNGQDGSLTGVFVKSPNLITYTGDADIALMNSYGMPSSSSSPAEDVFSPFF